MMRFVKAALYTAAFILFFFLLRETFPKYSGMLRYLLAFWILDGILWFSIQESLRKRSRPVRLFLGFLFWLPFLAIAGGLAYGWFIPFPEWNILLRTELLTVIVIGYVVKMFPALAALLSILIRLLSRSRMPSSIYERKHSSRAQRLPAASWWAGCLTGLLLLAGHFFGQYGFRTETEHMYLNGLPASFENLRIVHLSDFHLGGWTNPSRLEEAVGKVNLLKPDLIFITGDLATFSAAELSPFRSILSHLHAPDGIFLVAGNHDYGSYYRLKTHEDQVMDSVRFSGFAEGLGWTFLRNDHAILTRGSDSLAIIGVENWGAEKRFQKRADLMKAMQGISPGTLRILLSHDPTYWEWYISRFHPEIALTFSGHTHGGQIGLIAGPVAFSLVSMLHPYWNGLYTKRTSKGEQQFLYVNRGLGTIGYAGRIGIPPEITLLILHPASE